MYKVADYEAMVDDAIRMNAYEAAMRAAIKPGAIVVDIGAGTGIMSLLACKFGARRVYAIESDDAIAIAKENAAVNGMTDRIEFIHDLSTKITLPEKADVVVSDLRGTLPLCTHHIPSIVHARTHFLAPGGILIPERDDVWVAISEMSADASQTPWDRTKAGVSLPAVKEYLANTTLKSIDPPESLLTGPAHWASLDYLVVESPNFQGEVFMSALRDGKAEGVVAWFESILHGGIGFSSGPGQPQTVYGMSLFPFPQVTDLRAGDTAVVQLSANLVEGNYTWRWDTTIRCADTGAIKAEYQQSSFQSSPNSLVKLRKSADKFLPDLSDDGVVDHFVLSQMQGNATVGEIAQQLAERFPDRFHSWRAALTRVGELSMRYSR